MYVRALSPAALFSLSLSFGAATRARKKVLTRRKKSKRQKKRMMWDEYGLKSLICHLADLRKKSRICRKRKARTSWDIHTLTRNAHQLYNIVSIISAKKIHFARPKDDFTFTQTSRSLKLFNPLCQLSLADLSQTITAFSTYYGLMKAVVYVVVEEERLWFRSLFTRETNGENALTSVFVAEI